MQHNNASFFLFRLQVKHGSSLIPVRSPPPPTTPAPSSPKKKKKTCSGGSHRLWYLPQVGPRPFSCDLREFGLRAFVACHVFGGRMREERLCVCARAALSHCSCRCGGPRRVEGSYVNAQSECRECSGNFRLSDKRQKKISLLENAWSS